MTTTLLFDNDGILVDTEHLYFQATKTILKKVDFNLTEEIFIEYFLRQGTGAWHLVDRLDKQEYLKLRKERDCLYSEMLKGNSTLIGGVKETLIELKSCYTMGIVTSCKKNNFDVIHKTTGIIDYFDFVLTRENYQNSKPDPEPYLTALEKSGANADEAVIIEDSERGLWAAKAAGVNCVIIPRGFTLGGNFTGASKVLNDIRELPVALNNLKD